MKSTTFTFKDREGHAIFVYKWSPSSGKVRGAVQISHGMAEHAARYERFANALTSAGFIVYANDHRGHGKTAGSLEKAGFFAEENGFHLVIENMHQLTGIIKKENKKLPVYLFGHSMGSFLSQGYISVHGDDLAGCILCGTAGDNRTLARAGRIVARIQSALMGRKVRSKLLDTMSFGAFNKAFKPNRTQFDWLTRDNEEVDKYINDPWCGFVCTAGFFDDFLSGIVWIHGKKTMQNIPSGLPLFIVAGAKDPVGNYGKLVMQLVGMYRKLGMKDLKWKLYADARHEILNETNREEVMNDIVEWLKDH